MSKQTESLSKYFTRNKSNIESECNMFSTQTSRCFDSPYKDSLSEIKSLPSTDDPSNDFKTTDPVKKRLKVYPKVSTNKMNKPKTKSSKTKKSSKGNYIIKFTEDNFGQTDINPNQLQMALALSKSTYAVENPGDLDDTEDIPSFLCQAKIAKVNTTLERYGFKSNKPKLTVDLKRDRVQGKKSKVSKFRFITPILNTRTEEQRESLISSKVLTILQETEYFQRDKLQITKNEQKHELYSNFLKKFCCKRNIIVYANKLNQNEISSFTYYNKNLNISPTKYKCGCLLRDWDQIPGREKTPNNTDYLGSIKNDDGVSKKCEKFAELDSINTDADNSSLQKYKSTKDSSPIDHDDLENESKMSVRNSISPDLFGSDDELDFSPKTPEVQKTLSSPLFSFSPSKHQSVGPESTSYPNDFENKGSTISERHIFRSNTGISHFESYNDLEELSQEVYDLTQSSDSKSPLIDNNRYIESDIIHNSESDNVEDIGYDSKVLQSDDKVAQNIVNKIQDDAFLTTHVTDNPSDKYNLIDDVNNKYINEIENKQLDHSQDHKLHSSIVEENCVMLDLTQDSVYSSDSDNNIEHMELDRYQPNNSMKLNTKKRTIKETADCKLGERNSTRSSSSDFADDIMENAAMIRENNAVCVTTHPIVLENTFVSTAHNEFTENTCSFSEIPDECQSSILKVNSENYSYENSRNSFVRQEMRSLNSSKLLNVTDYVNDILINDLSTNQEISTQDLYQDTLNETNVSKSSCSQESIIISDEELNYSSIHSKDTEYLSRKSNFYEVSDTDDEINELELKDNQTIENLHSDHTKTTTENVGAKLTKLNEINLNKSPCSQESIIISDEELNYSSIQSKDRRYVKCPQSKSCFYELSDTDGDINDVELKDDQEIDHLHSALKNKYGQQKNISLVHNRITELKDRVSITRESLARAFLEESFTDFNEDKCTSATTEVKQNVSQNNTLCKQTLNQYTQNTTENVQITPEKLACPTFENDITPKNDLIIKTRNITPVINYDDLDTPNINKELEKFGLKPLKRRRGAKLLKYLYDCTHPFVSPNDINELSSDEDSQRIVKKRKKSDITSKSLNSQDSLEFIKQNKNIALVENLLEKENAEDLIFERKYSAKVRSCRIPLQIVWHNFICSNPEIEENILMYEPLQLEVLHSMLKEQSGCKFHVQDLLTFLDKKCITIRTGQEKGGQIKPKR